MVKYVGKEYFIVVQNPTLASSLCNPGARNKGSMEQGLGGKSQRACSNSGCTIHGLCDIDKSLNLSKLQFIDL